MFERPESFKKMILDSTLTAGGSESSFDVGSTLAPNETTGFAVIKQGNGSDARTEIVSYTAESGGTLTIGERGLPKYGTTGTALSKTGLTANKLRFSPGATVELANSHWYLGQVIDWANGLTGNGAVSMKIGLDTDVDITLYAANNDTNEPFLRYDASEDAWVFSDDGVTTTKMITGGSGLTAGDGIDITASAISVDLASDPGLELDGGTPEKLRVKIKALGGILRDSDGLSFNVDADLTITGDFDFTGAFSLDGTAVTSTADEINSLDGFTGTYINLNNVTDGSEVSVEHTHKSPAMFNGTRVGTSGSGTETVAVGAVPKYVLIETTCAGVLDNSVTYNFHSSGASDGSSNKCRSYSQAVVSNLDGDGINTTNCVVARQGATAAKSWLATITFSTTNVEIVWVADTTGGTDLTINYLMTVFY